MGTASHAPTDLGSGGWGLLFWAGEGFAALGEEDDRGVEELGLFGGEVGLVAEVEAVGAGEEGDREGGDVCEVGTVGFHEVGLVGLTIPISNQGCCRTAV